MGIPGYLVKPFSQLTGHPGSDHSAFTLTFDIQDTVFTVVNYCQVVFLNNVTQTSEYMNL